MNDKVKQASAAQSAPENPLAKLAAQQVEPDHELDRIVYANLSALYEDEAAQSAPAVDTPSSDDYAQAIKALEAMDWSGVALGTKVVLGRIRDLLWHAQRVQSAPAGEREAELVSALDHIAKTCNRSRTSTRRLRWIEQRAKWAIEGKPYDRDAFDLPKDGGSTAHKLSLEVDRLKAELAEVQRTQSAGVPVLTEQMVERAMNARMPGGASAWVWLFNCEGGQRPQEKHRDWFRTVVQAALAAAPAQPAAQDRVRAALSPENQRVVPVEPLLSNPHPLAAAQDQGEAQRLRVQVCKLGRYGAAFDPAGTHYAYTYADQPDNVGAMKLGRAALAVKPGGDEIDVGLSLLDRLSREGFGVFQIAASTGKEVGEATPSGYDQLWHWFGLSYAAWLTLPRVLMHAMPDDWQRKMAELLAEWDGAWSTSSLPSPEVTAKADGKYTAWPKWVQNYRHPDQAAIESVRATSASTWQEV